MAEQANPTNTTKPTNTAPTTNAAATAKSAKGTNAAERTNRAATKTRENGPKLRITFVKSVIGANQKQRDTIKALGLRRLHQTVEHTDTPEIRGMINRVSHLVRVEEVGA